MLNNEVDRLIVMAILKQAFVDILNAPHADPSNEIYYRKDSKMKDSAEAKRFINKDNQQFIFYCELLDMNPEWAANKFLKMIDYYVENPHISRNFQDGMQKMQLPS
jgi:hypothetical protein